MDLAYRGLAMGSRVRLTDGTSHTGFLGLSAPMPVGTTLTVSTEEGVSFEVVVVEVREQTVPGMVVKPVVSPAAQAWWGANVGVIAAVPPVDVVRPKRRPETEPALVDDGRETTVMEAVQPVIDDAGIAPGDAELGASDAERGASDAELGASDAEPARGDVEPSPPIGRSDRGRRRKRKRR